MDVVLGAGDGKDGTMKPPAPVVGDRILSAIFWFGCMCTCELVMSALHCRGSRKRFYGFRRVDGKTQGGIGSCD